jgi:hypothetical protein
MHLEHTCGPVGEACKVSAKWVAKSCKKAIRTDVTTKVDTIIENAKDKHGVLVPRTMAYRAKNEAVRVVLGDHVEQYRRIRDYLNTVIQTNPWCLPQQLTYNHKIVPLTFIILKNHHIRFKVGHSSSI